MPPTSDALSAQQLQLFVASLSGLAPDESRKAKSLYIRNAISEFKAVKASYQSFGQAQGCFSLIPVFWPVLKAQKATMASGLKLHEERIANALTVWKDDLGDEFAELQRLLAESQGRDERGFEIVRKDRTTPRGRGEALPGVRPETVRSKMRTTHNQCCGFGRSKFEIGGIASHPHHFLWIQAAIPQKMKRILLLFSAPLHFLWNSTSF